MATAVALAQDMEQFVTLRLNGQRLAVPLAAVRDVLRTPPATPVPLAPAGIAGLVNVRGQAIPALDLRAKLGLPPYGEPHSVKLVVVECDGERFALLADALDEVATITPKQIGKLTADDKHWQHAATGMAELNGERVLVMDVMQLIALFLRSK